MANELQTRQMTPLQKFNAQIRGANAQAYLTDVLGEKKETFVTSLVSIVGNDTNLQKCEPMSIIYAAMKSVPLGLPVESNLGYCAVIPYGTNASFQIMRNGWVELAMRTGQVKFIANEVVHKGELVKKNKFTGEYVFDEDKKESDEIIGYMAYIKLNNGFEKTVYWTAAECKAHALKYSQTFKKGYGIWKDNFDAMALKTVLKHLIVKYCPKSAELQAAIVNDQTVTNKDNVSTYADNPQNGIDEQGEQSASPSAMQKAEEVRAQVEAMKARRAGKQEPEVQEQPEDMPADTETGEIFNKGE